ncbi:MAG: FAD-binding domain-containing protein, partial [Hyphomicrobiaceae bacterium]
LSRFAPSTAEKFIQEVFWRGYFKGWLEQHPSIWASYREDVTDSIRQLDHDTELAQHFGRATSSRTGIDCFDTWTRELIETGYLHNHARMWFASIWIYTLQLPWQLGADFFYRHLIDGDPASNILSWRWVGGLHTKGKTYLARPNNIEKFTRNRFAPHGQLAAHAPPLSEQTAHSSQAIRRVDATLPKDNVALLITEEDGRPEELFSDLQPTAVISLLATKARSSLTIGERASAFARAAVSDATERASRHFGLVVDTPTEADDWHSNLSEFAHANGVNSIVTSYAPVGPVAEKLAAVRGSLTRQGVSLFERRREYDELAWPHASRGFFALKKKIPAILEDLQRSLEPRLL